MHKQNRRINNSNIKKNQRINTNIKKQQITNKRNVSINEDGN